MKTLVILSYLLAFVWPIKQAVSGDPDEYLNTTMLIRSKGYPAEEHDVFTMDGYILTVDRIPNPNKPVVFLQHGLLDSSSSFVINFRNQSLGFILWDAGYDVWMGNMRGNTYGLRHSKLSHYDEEFWNFSWTEMAEYDLPAMIDYALNISGQKNLIYIGHSQGTLIAFSQLGINHRLAEQIKLFIALGPVAHVAHIKSSVRVLSDIGKDSNQKIWYFFFGKKDFLPSAPIRGLAHAFCNDVYCGPTTHLNESRIAVYSAHSPAGSSIKNMIHFAQMVQSKKLQKYNYGSAKENMLKYHQAEPHVFDLSLIKTPVVLYSASNDWLSVQDDIAFIRKTLPSIVDDYVIDGWNHIDFLWAIDTKPVLYDRMIKLMKMY